MHFLNTTFVCRRLSRTFSPVDSDTQHMCAVCIVHCRLLYTHCQRHCSNILPRRHRHRLISLNAASAFKNAFYRSHLIVKFQQRTGICTKRTKDYYRLHFLSDV